MNAYAVALSFDDREVATAEIAGGGSIPAGGPGSLTGPGGIGPAGSVGAANTVETQSGDFPIDRGLGNFGGVTINVSDPSSAGS